MFHGGDSDSTGVMAAAWFGALYGYADVPENNYKVGINSMGFYWRGMDM